MTKGALLRHDQQLKIIFSI